MAAWLQTVGWLASPVGTDCHLELGVELDHRRAQHLSEALHAGQFVVRYRAQGSLAHPLRLPKSLAQSQSG